MDDVETQIILLLDFGVNMLLMVQTYLVFEFASISITLASLSLLAVLALQVRICELAGDPAGLPGAARVCSTRRWRRGTAHAARRPARG